MGAVVRMVAMAHVAANAPSAQPARSAGGAEARVRVAAEALFADRFPASAHRLVPRILRLSADVPETAPLRLVLPPTDGLPSGHTHAELFADGSRAGAVLLYVAHFDSVVVARRDLPRGDTLGSDAVETAWLETTRFHGTPLLAADLQGTALPVARRPLAAGTALRTSDLAWPVAVETGAAVRVRYLRHGLRLVLDAHARERGAVGDVIRVFARATGAIYRVRLTAPGEADWIETL